MLTSRLTSTLSRSIAHHFASTSTKRNPAFSQLTPHDITFFQDNLSPGSVVTDNDALLKYNTDWLQQYHGSSTLALLPSSTEDISTILSHCNNRTLAITMQGGNTGLVGGSVPLFDEIVLSMSRMNHVLDFDEISGIVVVEAGMILEELDNWLEQRGHMVPLDLGAKGSCQIGGNVATNAGGLRYVKYGSLHGTVLGMEVVLPDGSILNELSKLRKDNTGYDIKQLFIGSEGTLGAITKLAISVPRRPLSTNTMFLALHDFHAVQKTYAKAREQLAEILSAVEFADRQSLAVLLGEEQDEDGNDTQCKDFKEPFDDKYPFHLLLEVSGSNEQHDTEKMNSFLDYCMKEGLILDGVVAQNQTQSKEMWALRENITVGLAQTGHVYKYDFSLPLHCFYDIVEETRKRLKKKDPTVIVVGYGHVGDSNVHLNVCTPGVRGVCPEVLEVIEPFVYDYVREHQGSISAEHGLGQMKPDKIYHTKGRKSVEVMVGIKKMFDPNGIMNPGKHLSYHVKR